MDEIFERITRDLGNGSLILLIACILLYRELKNCQTGWLECLKNEIPPKETKSQTSQQKERGATPD